VVSKDRQNHFKFNQRELTTGGGGTGIGTGIGGIMGGGGGGGGG
jgi:hypothetical protein